MKIGLYFVILDGLPDLRIGLKELIFSIDGNSPLYNDRLNSIEKNMILIFAKKQFTRNTISTNRLYIMQSR